MVDAQNLHVIASDAVNGNVVFVEYKLSGSEHSAGPAHARKRFEPGRALLQFKGKRGGTSRAILRNVSGDFVNRAKCRLGPFKRHILQIRYLLPLR
jgi:hypothetical protein